MLTGCLIRAIMTRDASKFFEMEVNTMENDSSQTGKNLCGLVASAVTAVCLLLLAVVSVKKGGNQ